MNNYKYLIFLFFLFANSFAYSQTSIKGKISYGNSEKNVSTTILLKEGENTIAYSFSNEDDSYELETDKVGSFTIIFSALNFETKTLNIEITSKTKVIEKDITLLYKSTEIKEVFIQSKLPIKVKKDTIVFDAKSFLQGDEQVIEDLLKKIPGLNVSSDGTIKVGNQEVEKIMIDGDDFFEKGYKILTKNMPVNPIDKVELYHNYSNNKHLKGIENSQKVALNLTLKEDAKRVWFGNLLAGYGLFSENRYEVKGNLMNFGKKSKYYFLTNLNNTGLDAVGDINHLIRPFRLDEPSSIGDNQSVNSLLSFGNDLPNLKKKRVNLNNAEMLSLNSIFTISDKIKLRTLGFLNTDENNFFRNSFQSFTIGSTTFENFENFEGKKNQITGFGKADLSYDISKTKTIEYTGKFNKTNEKNRSELLFNSDLLKERVKSNNQLFDQKIVYTNKFKENKVFLLTGRYINEKTPQNFSVNQFIFSDLFPQNANNTIQTSENKMQFGGFEAHLLDKKRNNDLLEIRIGNQLRIDDLKTCFQMLNNEDIVAQPSDYKNNLTYSTDDFFLSAKYRFKLGNFNLLTQSDFHQIFNKFESLNEMNIQNSFFIIPKIGLDWEINDKNKIITSYSYNTTNAGILDVYTNFIQTGFRTFSKGTNEFNQLNSSNAIINYTYGSWGDKFFANTFLSYSKNYDFFSTNSMIAQNYSKSEKVIIKDREFLMFSTNVDYYFKPLKTNLKIAFGGSKANYKNFVNGYSFREVKNLSAEYGFELRSGFKGIFNYHFGTKWNYNEVKTTSSNSFTNNMTFVDLSLEINDKLNFQLQSERYLFGNIDDINQYYFMDLEARYTVKENKLTFFISGNNLLNTVTFKNYSISDINISKTEYRLQPRYILLKIEYRFQ